MLEEQDGRQQDHSALGRVLYQIGKDNPELYLGIHDAVCSTAYDGTVRPVGEKLMDVLAPAGEATISVRVAREGRKMLIIRGQISILFLWKSDQAESSHTHGIR